MNEQLANFKAQWQTLPERTRLLVLAGTALIALALLISAGWMPLQRELARLRGAVPREAAELEWMRAQAPLAKSARARAVTSSGALSGTLEQSATTHGVRGFVTKIEAEGNSGARLTIEAMPFDTLVTWLSDLQAVQGAVVEDATIEAHATVGLVNARLRLRSGGA
jgi:type II secretory pathway component PulM